MQFNNISVYLFYYPTFNIRGFIQIIPNIVQKDFFYILDFHTEEKNQFSDDVRTIHNILCQFGNRRKY